MTDTPPTGAADAAPVVVDASSLLPMATALLRWLVHGLGMWLVLHGMAQDRADALEPILTGLALSGSALVWSVVQKRLASERIKTAALANPANVVLR